MTKKKPDLHFMYFLLFILFLFIFIIIFWAVLVLISVYTDFTLLINFFKTYLRLDNVFLFLFWYTFLFLVILFVVSTYFYFRDSIKRDYLWYTLLFFLSSYILINLSFSSSVNKLVLNILFIFLFLVLVVFMFALFLSFKVSEKKRLFKQFIFSLLKISSIFILFFWIIVYLFTHQFKYWTIVKYDNLFKDYSRIQSYTYNNISNKWSTIWDNFNWLKVRDWYFPYILCDLQIADYKAGIYPKLLYENNYVNYPVFPWSIIFSKVEINDVFNLAFMRIAYSTYYFLNGKNNILSMIISPGKFFSGKVTKVYLTNKLPKKYKNYPVYGTWYVRFILSKVEDKHSNVTLIWRIKFLDYFNWNIEILWKEIKISSKLSWKLNLKKMPVVFYSNWNENILWIDPIINIELTWKWKLKINPNIYPINAFYNWVKWWLNNGKFKLRLDKWDIVFNKANIGHSEFYEALSEAKNFTGFVQKLLEIIFKEKKINIKNDGYFIKTWDFYLLKKSILWEDRITINKKNKICVEIEQDKSKKCYSLKEFNKFKEYLQSESFLEKWIDNFYVNIVLKGGDGIIKRADCKAITMEEYLDKYANDYILNSLQWKFALFLICLWFIIVLVWMDVYLLIQLSNEKN